MLESLPLCSQCQPQQVGFECSLWNKGVGTGKGQVGSGSGHRKRVGAHAGTADGCCAAGELDTQIKAAANKLRDGFVG